MFEQQGFGGDPVPTFASLTHSKRSVAVTMSRNFSRMRQYSTSGNTWAGVSHVPSGDKSFAR